MHPRRTLMQAPMAPPLLSLKSIALTFGGTPLLTDAGFELMPGDRMALVGRNGSGKSTLLKIAADRIEADGGEVFVKPGTTVSYLAQEPDFDGRESVGDYVRSRLGPAQEAYRADYLMDELKLDPGQDPQSLSGGEARRAALAAVLAPEPDVLLLDEPTNHLDLPAIEWLEAELKSLKSALVLISHDRAFLNALTRVTVWLDRGVTRRLERGFAHFEEWRDRLHEEEEQAQHKLARQIAREEDWLRYGVTARRKRNVRRLGELHQLRERHKAHQGPQGQVNLTMGEGRQSGQIVIDAEAVSKRLGDRTLVRDLTLRVLRGDRVAIVGANGAGKTTLIKTLLGQVEADNGSIRRGTNLDLAMLDQTRAALAPNTALADALTGGGKDTLVVNGAEKHVTAYMKDFLFSPEQMRTPLSELSGGERARVMLARALAQPSNLLVLDEPTNDLDLGTLDLLQEMVGDFPGTVILVSHDRDFIDRVATTTLIAEGDGHWTPYAGGYADMVALRGHGVRADPAGKPANKPKERAKPEPAKPAPQKTRKLSFKQKHALETLPDEIAGLANERDRLQEKLADPDLYARDPGAFTKLSEKLDAVSAQHDDKETEWLELEMLREEIEGG